MSVAISPRVLLTTTRLPYPPITGDKLLGYYRLKYLSKSCRITLLSFIDQEAELAHLPELAPFCDRIETVLVPRWRSLWRALSRGFRGLPLQVLYYESAEFGRRLERLLSSNSYDIVHSVMIRGARHTMHLNGVPKVLDMIDSMSLNMQRRAEAESVYRAWGFRAEAQRLRLFEQEACQAFDRVLVVSSLDQRHIGSPNVSVVPLGVEVTTLGRRGGGGRPTIAFSGNLSYFPNQMAAYFLIKEILPALRRRIPNVVLKVVGAFPPPELRRLAREREGVEVTGYVKDLRAALAEADLAVCPMRAGSGMQDKVLEAMACGLPVVASRLAVGDIKAQEGEHLLVADEVADIVEAVCRILNDPELAERLSQNGYRLVADQYSWQSANLRVAELYAELLRGRA